jgi:cephalosporin-C deacetylase-like acetyl esterase
MEKSPKIIYYTGQNHKQLADFLGLTDEEYSLFEMKTGGQMMTFEGMYLSPNSVVRYNPDRETIDFFILEKRTK